MPGDSLRALRIALPTTEGSTPPATWLAVPVEDYDHDASTRGREEVKYLRNTVNRSAETIRKGEYDKMKVMLNSNYTYLEYFIASMFGIATATGHSGATGAYDHEHIENDSDQVMWLRFLTSNGWWEMPDCVVDTWTPKQDNETRLKHEFDMMGKKAYPISVQTVTFSGGPAGGSTILTIPIITGRFPAQPTAAIAYNASAADMKTALCALSRIGTHGVDVTRTGTGSAGSPYVYTILIRERYCPIGTLTATDSWTGGTSPETTIATTAFTTAFPLSESWAAYEPSSWGHFLGKIDGTAAHIKSWSMSIKRNRKPEYDGTRDTVPSYFSKPDWDISGSFLPDYKLSGDLASMWEKFRNGPNATAVLDFDYVTADAIGTGTPTVPHFLLKVFRAAIKSAKQEVKNMPTTTPIQFTGEYSVSDGKSISTLLTNELNTLTTS